MANVSETTLVQLRVVLTRRVAQRGCSAAFSDIIESVGFEGFKTCCRCSVLLLLEPLIVYAEYHWLHSCNPCCLGDHLRATEDSYSFHIYETDSTLEPRCRMTMLGSYMLEGGQLYYNVDALKAFGMLKMEEKGGSELIVLNNLQWFKVPTNNLVVVGSVSGHRVETSPSVRAAASAGAAGLRVTGASLPTLPERASSSSSSDSGAEEPRNDAKKRLKTSKESEKSAFLLLPRSSSLGYEPRRPLQGSSDPCMLAASDDDEVRSLDALERAPDEQEQEQEQVDILVDSEDVVRPKTSLSLSLGSQFSSESSSSTSGLELLSATESESLQLVKRQIPRPPQRPVLPEVTSSRGEESVRRQSRKNVPYAWMLAKVGQKTRRKIGDIRNSYFAGWLVACSLFVVLLNVFAIAIVSLTYHPERVHVEKDVDTRRQCKHWLKLLMTMHFVGLPNIVLIAPVVFPNEFFSLYRAKDKRMIRRPYLLFCEMIVAVQLGFMMFVAVNQLLNIPVIVECHDDLKPRQIVLFYSATVVWLVLLRQIVVFCRFLTHLKLQADSSNDSSHTSALGSWFRALKSIPFRSERTRFVKEFKKLLYRAVARGDVLTVETILSEMQSKYKIDRIQDIYKPPVLWFYAFAKSRKNPLHIAVKRANGANFLKVASVSLTGLVRTYATPLQQSTFTLRSDLSDYLLECGGDVALTPLHEAAATDNVGKIKWLLARGIHVNTLGERVIGVHRRTPLHWAAVVGKVNAAKLLLVKGADPNAKDRDGRTPLHWAARNNHHEVVSLLLAYNAKPDATDDEGIPVVCFAAEAEGVDSSIFSSLVAAGASLRTQVSGVFTEKRGRNSQDYDFVHAQLAQKVREHLEIQEQLTCWMDTMDPSGIGGGAVWREEIARGIYNCSLVLSIVCDGYTKSEWCLKELALAKILRKPGMTEQAYSAYRRQENPRTVVFDIDEALFTRRWQVTRPLMISIMKDGRQLDKEERENVASIIPRRRRRRRKVKSATANEENDGLANTDDEDIVASPRNGQVGGSYDDQKPLLIYSPLGAASSLRVRVKTDLEGFGFRCRGLDENRLVEQMRSCRGVVLLVEVPPSSGEKGSDEHKANKLVRKQLIASMTRIVTAAQTVNPRTSVYPVLVQSNFLDLSKMYTLARSELFYFVDGGGWSRSVGRLSDDNTRDDVCARAGDGTANADCGVDGVGMVPFLLQARSFLKFVTPHKITETLVAPPDAVRETINITELCPASGFLMSRVWWNVVPTHYYTVEHGRICHVVVPQYNLHGGYRIGDSKAAPFHTTPDVCLNNSYVFENYLYHGSVGYYSFYEEAQGTYCTLDKTAYALVGGLGTFDINGWFLAQDAGSEDYRRSYWYGSVGAIWLIYRFLVLRRSYIAYKRYGRKCDQMGEVLRRKLAIVFVHENLRLSAHGANNYQRAVLLYLLIEGLMSDLFLLIAHDGIFAEIQYISIGYNLSGILLVVWEIVESLRWLNEKQRMLMKRLIYSYESSLIGEFLSAAVQQDFLVALNRSDLKESRPSAMAVSYYVWSLLWHTIYVMMLIGFIISVRVIWAVIYVSVRNRTLTIFTRPCCIDTVLGPRCRMTMLGSYHLEGERLFYSFESLKAFGIMKMIEEDGAELLAVNQLHWVAVPDASLVVIVLVLQNMNKGKAHCLKGGFCTQAAAESEAGFWNAQRKLLAAWLFVGMLPFILQTRSYLKYATPHKISETLLVPPDVEQETTNLTALCPVEGVIMGQIWWNIEVTHYYRVKHGLLCHFVVPQYNTHGNYLMGSTKTTASFTTPASCARESIPFEQYLYHGSIGYCSFYEEAGGTYCLEDRTAYVSARALGTMDINGSYLVRYTGSEGYSWSYWALFCYESSLLGEVIAAAGQEHFITILSRSSLRRTHSTTLAVSYYFWSLVGHGAFVVSFIAFIISFRALWAVSYIRWKHGHTWLIFSTPCSVDTALGMRNKMTMLGGYQLEDGKLFYTTNALLAFGLLRMEEEDGVEFWSCGS
ncbi:unnamed protein product [Phytophthora lilii]|uniref:Unnamed protein product n=1 Tax=Phytophthora lilii TaxID=2077276 RepID=A0A9W6WQ83_9STRA|nr:unnamed protein product [Phytophthora lilii]